MVNEGQLGTAGAGAAGWREVLAEALQAPVVLGPGQQHPAERQLEPGKQPLRNQVRQTNLRLAEQLAGWHPLAAMTPGRVLPRPSRSLRSRP